MPETLDIAANEIFLTLHRLYINKPMKQSAMRLAQTVPPRSIDKLDYATLWLHCIVRKAWLGIGEDREYQALVDQHHGVIYNTTDPIRWVKPSFIWLPQFDGIVRQIYLSLVERYQQFYFAQHCWTELIRRGQQNKYVKYTFILLNDSHDMCQERHQANQWLRDKSRNIATCIGVDPDVGEDARQDWLRNLLGLPPHLQIQKVGTTGKAIRDGIIDLQRKGGQYEHIALDESLNAMPDKSTKDPSAKIIGDEFTPRLLACQPQIEGILSQGRPEKGERRFKVMQLMLTQTPQNEIAEQLRTSAATITRDKEVIKQSWQRIEEVLY